MYAADLRFSHVQRSELVGKYASRKVIRSIAHQYPSQSVPLRFSLPRPRSAPEPATTRLPTVTCCFGILGNSIPNDTALGVNGIAVSGTDKATGILNYKCEVISGTRHVQHPRMNMHSVPYYILHEFLVWPHGAKPSSHSYEIGPAESPKTSHELELSIFDITQMVSSTSDRFSDSYSVLDHAQKARSTSASRAISTVLEYGQKVRSTSASRAISTVLEYGQKVRSTSTSRAISTPSEKSPLRFRLGANDTFSDLVYYNRYLFSQTYKGTPYYKDLAMTFQTQVGHGARYGGTLYKKRRYYTVPS
ncbi:hypothetical protein FIBSPDRAFT_903560 [Athelia psychrophila]|uniref:Uncharacterized protein n=1 Tax=Athelia psychrophila TaxID=1759441 RepID=A0A167VTM0_9AGAM|nr:hypothetical protein FIBSPDRAFT_903560 [Fibularhizoctonia sp. CBS 109695]